MDKKIIRAYLWQEVIRLAFSPSGRKEQKKWMRQFGKSLNYLVQGDSPPVIKLQEILPQIIYFSIELPINLIMDGNIDAENKFTVEFLYLPPSNNRELMWIHDVDGAYFSFPVQEFLTHHNQRRSMLGEFSDEDVEAVLDSLIFHPAVHQHIEYPIDNHDIRIGGGTDNPFLFLFHLRYQFCPCEEARQNEKNRLIKLFSDAVRECKDRPIPISTLMDMP